MDWAWTGGSAPAPETVITCADRTGDVLVALWPAVAGGSRIGLYPLSGGDEQAGRLDSAMLAPWRLRDTSLPGSPAKLGAGLIRLAPPVLPASYAEDIAALLGPHDWKVVTDDAPQRSAPDPGGRPVLIRDTVFRARRGG